ncbi:CENP-B DNA-binding domain protein [Cooperia oncophora]
MESHRAAAAPSTAPTAAATTPVDVTTVTEATNAADTNDQERRKKKPYKELTLQEKVQLIRLAEENSGMSQAAIAERYTIAKSNVCRILQRKKEYLMAYESAGYAGSRKRKLKSATTDMVHDTRQMGLLVPAPSDSTGNETLRAHMYKQHQISRMFMCRCCNWAFPDKTSLHMHIQAREEGKSITVPVIGKGLAPDGVDSPYPNLHPINNNTLPQIQNPGVLTPNPGLSFFSAPPPPLTSTAEDMSRLRDRLVLNSLMTQPGFGLAAAWLNNLPKPIPTTKPLVDLMKKESREEDECEVNVENDTAHAEDDKLNVSSSESDEGKSLVIKRTESPCENGSSTSSDGLSPAHTSSAHSPVNLFKKGDTPSAFHHLNVDSRFVISPSHVSPSETHSSASPNGCYDCAVYKTKLTMADNKCRYLESRGNTLQTEAVRAQAQISSAEAALRALEAETRALREQTEMLHRRLLDCQATVTSFLAFNEWWRGGSETITAY